MTPFFRHQDIFRHECLDEVTLHPQYDQLSR
jgi:hypothetical protein